MHQMVTTFGTCILFIQELASIAFHCFSPQLLSRSCHYNNVYLQNDSKTIYLQQK